jgi:hypothetical protein
MASFACSEGNVAAQNDLVLHRDRKAHAYIGSHSIRRQLAGVLGNIAGIKESIKSILAQRVLLQADLRKWLIEIHPARAIDLARATGNRPVRAGYQCPRNPHRRV